MNQRVLVLDDEPEIGKLVVRVAHSVGMEARSVTSVVEFLDAITEWKPTLLVIDLVMPGQDGVELLRNLAEVDHVPPIVLISGVAGRVLDAARRTANERGLRVTHAINKPLSVAALKTALSDTPTGHLVAQSERPDPAMPMDEGEYERAIVEQQIDIALLPKIECQSHRVVGIEALARWRRSGSKQILAGQFIAGFEGHGLIRALSDAVFEKAMRWLSHLEPADRPILCLNLSPLLLEYEDFAERLSESANRYGIDTGNVVLELAENRMINQPAQALAAITGLRLRGFRMAIENVGSRHAALASLTDFPFSEIKIDRSFVRSIAKSAESRAIVESLIRLGHSLELEVIAVGVQDSEADRFLADAGCDMAQGYLYAKPMSPEDASGWLAQRRTH